MLSVLDTVVVDDFLVVGDEFRPVSSLIVLFGIYFNLVRPV